MPLGAPIVLPLGLGHAWIEALDTSTFDFIKPSREEKRRVRSLALVRSDLLALLDRLGEACGWKRENIHLFGYSQGGTVAVDLAMHCACDATQGGALASCCSVSGTLLEETLVAADPSALAGPSGRRKAKTSILLTHGEDDVRS